MEHRDPESTETHHLLDFAPLAEAHVLEIGCGDGRLTRRYIDAGRKVVGVDLDQDRLRTARQNLSPVSRLSFVLANATFLPFRSETFDLALLAWSL